MKTLLILLVILALSSCASTTTKDPFDVMLDAQMLKIAESPL